MRKSPFAAATVNFPVVVEPPSRARGRVHMFGAKTARIFAVGHVNLHALHNHI